MEAKKDAKYVLSDKLEDDRFSVRPPLDEAIISARGSVSYRKNLKSSGAGEIGLSFSSGGVVFFVTFRILEDARGCVVSTALFLRLGVATMDHLETACSSPVSKPRQP